MARARRALLVVFVLFSLGPAELAVALPRDPKAVRTPVLQLQRQLDHVGNRAGRAYSRYLAAGRAERQSLHQVHRFDRGLRWLRHHRVHGKWRKLARADRRRTWWA